VLLDLIHNIALLVALAVALQTLTQRLNARRWVWGVISGLLFGLVGIVGMMTPLRFAPGVIYDGRSIVLSLAGLFGGGITAAIAAALSGAYRWHLGGAGVWAGLSVIVESAALGVALRHLRKRDERWMEWRRLLLFGVLVHALMLALQLLIPGGVGLEVARRFGLPILTLYPLAFLVAADVFLEGERRRDKTLALTQSEARYRSLFENNHAVMLLISPEDGRIVDANPAACAFYGWQREELRRKRIEEINTLTPEEIQREIETAREGQRNHFEFCHRLADGSVREVEVFSGPIDFNGVSLLYSLVHDVSDRRKAEKALRESEAFFRMVMDSLPIGIAVNTVFPKVEFLYHNENFLKHYGITREDIASPDSFWEAVYKDPAYREKIRKQVNDDLASGDPQRTFWENVPIAREGEETRYVNAYNTSVVKGDDHLFISTVIDITERKRAEEAIRLHNLLFEESLNEIYLFSSDSLNFWQVNRAGQHNLGYTMEELRALTPLDIKPEITREHFESLLAPLRRGEMEGIVFETVHARKDGSRYPIEAHVQLLEHADQPLFAAIIIDISDRAAMEEKHRKIEEQLFQSQKMETVGQLAGGIAHDFNNLLQVILGYGDMAMEDAPEGSELRQSLEEVLKASRRAETLVKQLLAFSRRQVLEMKDINLNDAIAEMLKMLQRVIGEHISLDMVSGHDLGTIRADTGQIGQILTNLCVNARDAMPEGGSITIETENVRFDEEYCVRHVWAKPGRYVLLSVTDTGCGMDRETMDKAFEPFFTTKELGRGTGLGLATVYGLVKQHDGFIHVYSEMGQGTTFKIYLPVVERSASAVGSKIVGPTPRGTETILLAEDDATVRNLTRSILKHAGYTLLLAADGEEAWELFDRHADDIDLVILDVMMPKMGGRAVYERIRQTHPDTRVLFASGYSMNAIHTNFVLDQGVSLIQKPYQRDDLLRKVRQVLDADPDPILS